MGYVIKRIGLQAVPDDRAWAGSLSPSTQLTGFASDAVLAGIVDKRTRVRADDPDREFPHGGILPVRRIRAAGASRKPDRRALRSPDSDVRGVVTMQPRLAEDLGVLALVQRDR